MQREEEFTREFCRKNKQNIWGRRRHHTKITPSSFIVLSTDRSSLSPLTFHLLPRHQVPFPLHSWTKQQPVTTLVPSPTPVTSLWPTIATTSSGKAATMNSNTNKPLHELLVTTTDHHFLCHHHKENHLDLLYQVAMASEPLVIVGHPPFYYSLHWTVLRVN